MCWDDRLESVILNVSISSHLCVGPNHPLYSRNYSNSPLTVCFPASSLSHKFILHRVALDIFVKCKLKYFTLMLILSKRLPSALKIKSKVNLIYHCQSLQRQLLHLPLSLICYFQHWHSVCSRLLSILSLARYTRCSSCVCAQICMAEFFYFCSRLNLVIQRS